MSNEQIGEYMADLATKIATYGHACVGVFDPDGPVMFTYTIGLAIEGGCEYVIAGMDPRQATGVLNGFAEQVRDGFRPLEGASSRDVLVDLPVRFVTMGPDNEAHQARNYWAGGEAPVRIVQMLWPDAQGRLPGDPAMDEQFSASQRVPGSRW